MPRASSKPHPGTSAPSLPVQVWRDLVTNPRHGPLPVLLVGLTVLTGVVDAVSILHLGRVFVANMTGNVVFVGFALAGAPGFSLSASLFALGGFLLGAGLGGVLVARLARDRGILLAAVVPMELVLVATALGLSIAAGDELGAPARDAMAALLATAMGLQNAMARRLAVPDLTTTVLTMTLTGLAADLRGGAVGPTIVRRLLAVGAMFGGAVVGAVLVLQVSPTAALAVAVGLLACVTLLAGAMLRRPAPWRHSPT